MGSSIGKVAIYIFPVTQKLEFLVMDILAKFYPKYSTNKTRGVQSVSFFVSGYWEYLKTLQAMQAHKSQLVWFRWLYVAFSKYLWVNLWIEMKA